MKKERFPHKPFTPFVTLEEALTYDSQMPETHTASPLLNAVLEALEVLPHKTVENVTEYLEVDGRALSSTLKIIIGLTLSELHEAWILDRLKKLKEEHPDWNGDQLGRALGYCDNTGLWKFLKRTKHEELINKRNFRPYIEPFDSAKWFAEHGKGSGEE